MTRGEGGWLLLPSAGLSPAILRQFAWRTTASWVSTSIRRRVRDSASWVSTSIRRRARQPIRRRRGQLQVQERPQTQRIGHPPRNPPLRRQPLEIADEQHPEISTRTQTRTAQPVRVESRAQLLDERIESGIRQNPVQPLEVRMPVTRRKVRRVHPHRRRLARRRSLAHRHGRSVYGLDRAGAKPDPRLSPQAVRLESLKGGAL